MSTTRPALAIVGGGNMAQAIVRGGIDAGLLDPRGVAVCDPVEDQRDHFRKLGVRAVEQPGELMAWVRDHDRPGAACHLLLAVKPQSLAQVGQQWAGLLSAGDSGEGRVVVTILAGAPSAKVRAALGSVARVVRVMPNTPASIRKGCTAVARGAGARVGDETSAIELFSALGRVVIIEEELMDAFTALAGSGPAYVFYLAEAMTRAGIEIGFDAQTAADVARWTVAGAGALLEASSQPAGTLRAAVTSKGGTTAAATSVLDDRKVIDAFVAAIVAARDRGRELGRG